MLVAPLLSLLSLTEVEKPQLPSPGVLCAEGEAAVTVGGSEGLGWDLLSLPAGLHLVEGSIAMSRMSFNQEIPA